MQQQRSSVKTARPRTSRGDDLEVKSVLGLLELGNLYSLAYGVYKGFFPHMHGEAEAG